METFLDMWEKAQKKPYRGKGIYDGAWHKGFYLEMNGFSYITPDGIDMYEVKPETVGMFTGFFDFCVWECLKESERQELSKEGYTTENWTGYPLYHGDIVEGYEYSCGDEGHPPDIVRAVIQWHGGQFRLVDGWREDDGCFWVYFEKDTKELIGNIWDNPDLLSRLGHEKPRKVYNPETKKKEYKYNWIWNEQRK